MMDLFENDVVDGKITSTRMRTGQWSTNSQIIQVCGSWFCRTNGKRPKWTTPTVNTVSDRRSIVIKEKAADPVEAMPKGRLWWQALA